jgi:hypothetical protein
MNMKKLLLFACLFVVGQLAMSQMLSFGLKGGVQSSKIKFSDFSADVDVEGQTVSNVKFEPSSYEMGFHFGAFARVKVLSLFVQPEVYFSNSAASINVKSATADSIDDIATLKMNKIDIPILIGMKFGPARVNLGPVATFNLSSKTKGSDQIKSIVGDKFESTKSATFGLQVGVGLDILKKVTVDLRYEFGLSKLGDKVTIGGQEFKTDQRVNQFVASIGYMF